jgi:hypothetical protein
VAYINEGGRIASSAKHRENMTVKEFIATIF